MSDTPETDRIERRWRDYALLSFDDVFDLASRLERERNETRNAMAQAQGELDLKTLDFERMREQRDKLAKQRDAERSLADRLAEILQLIANEDYRGNRPHHCAVAYRGVKEWKEARSE